MKKKIYCALIFLLIFPIPMFADGGGPVLLIFNGIMFTIGQIWILTAEFVYLKILLKGQKNFLIIKWTILINLISTLLSGLLIPFLLAAFGFIGVMQPFNSNTLNNLILALGTWIAGSNFQFTIISFLITLLGFIATYFLTVFIEYKFLYKFQKEMNLFDKKSILKHSYLFNLISYSGIFVLFIFGALFL